MCVCMCDFQVEYTGGNPTTAISFVTGYWDTCGNYFEYTGSNLNTTISFKCADIGICFVI